MADVWFVKRGGLWARCLRACGWVGVGAVSGQGLRALRTLVLTYLLAPADWGVWFLVWCVLGLAQELSDVGIRQALIQQPQGADDTYLNSAWWLNLGRNVLLAVILFCVSPFIAAAYADRFDEDAVRKLLRLSSLILLGDGLSSVGLTLLRKQLAFRALTLVNMTANLGGVVVAIVVVWATGGVEGIVWGEVAAAGATCVMSYGIHPFRPRWRWSVHAGRRLLGYGLMVYLATLAWAAGHRLDVIILSRVASEDELGIYGLAMTAIMMPCGVFSLLTIGVGLPALSLIQHNRELARRGTAEMVRAAQTVALPLFVLIGLLAEDLVRILPVRYAHVGGMLRILAVYGFFEVAVMQLTPVLYAINRVHWCFIRGMMYLAIIGTLMVPMYHVWGLSGAGWAVNIGVMVTQIFILAVTRYELQWPWREWWQEAGILGRWLLRGGTVFLVCYAGLRIAGYEWSDCLWVRLLSCLGGLAGYASGCWRHYRQTRLSSTTIARAAGNEQGG